MSDISIQFHATPEELKRLLSEFLSEPNITVTAMKLRPFATRTITADDLDSCFLDIGWRRWIFSLGEPARSMKNELEFAEMNPDSLRLDVGRLSAHGLEQSWLTTRTKNPSAMVVWMRVASRVKAITKAGVTATNPVTGAKATIKTFRFTAGAKAIEEAGTPILPPAGTALLSLA